MKKQIFKLSGLAALMIAASCSKNVPPASVQHVGNTIPVTVMPLTKTDVYGSVYASGQFTTDDETMLSFKTGGVISKIYVKEGDRIRKGQILAKLDLTEISAQVNQAQIAMEKATRDYQRAQNLYKDSVATLEQLQNAGTGLEMARQQLAAARFNLSFSEIRAASDGVIMKKIANEGQIVGSGTPVVQTSSKGKADWILKVAVSDREWAQTAIHDKAVVNIQALGIDKLDGYVFAKAENIDPQTGSFTLDIKLKSAQRLNIASGMFGKAEVFLSQKKHLWKIPYDALLDGNAGQGFVFVTNDNKKAVKVPVQIENIERDHVLINDGLLGYNNLVVAGSAYLSDQSDIQVVSR